MRTKLLVTLAIAASAISFAPTPSIAENVVVTCASSRIVNGFVSCASEYTYRFHSFGPASRYALELTTPATHCSDVSYDVLDRDRVHIGSTRFLSAGQSAVTDLSASFPEGTARVIIRAWGRIGGCNTGVLQSWGVDVRPILLD